MDHNTQIHAFKTFLGMPADVDTPPVCGAPITREYGTPRPTERCPECDRQVAEYHARVAALKAKEGK